MLSSQNFPATVIHLLIYSLLIGFLYSQPQTEERGFVDRCRVTVKGCICRLFWEFDDKVYSGCANPDDDVIGAWCTVERGCPFEDNIGIVSQQDGTVQRFDYCTPSCQQSSQSNDIDCRVSNQKCKCFDNWVFGGQQNYVGCANPDNDPLGPWCLVYRNSCQPGSALGTAYTQNPFAEFSYDYCPQACTQNTYFEQAVFQPQNASTNQSDIQTSQVPSNELNTAPIFENVSNVSPVNEDISDSTLIPENVSNVSQVYEDMLDAAPISENISNVSPVYQDSLNVVTPVQEPVSDQGEVEVDFETLPIPEQEEFEFGMDLISEGIISNLSLQEQYFTLSQSQYVTKYNMKIPQTEEMDMEENILATVEFGVPLEEQLQLIPNELQEESMDLDYFDLNLFEYGVFVTSTPQVEVEILDEEQYQYAEVISPIFEPPTEEIERDEYLDVFEYGVANFPVKQIEQQYYDAYPIYYQEYVNERYFEEAFYDIHQRYYWFQGAANLIESESLCSVSRSGCECLPVWMYDADNDGIMALFMGCIQTKDARGRAWCPVNRETCRVPPASEYSTRDTRTEIPWDFCPKACTPTRRGKCTETINNCECRLRWEYEGLLQQGCTHPDGTAAFSWCIVRENCKNTLGFIAPPQFKQQWDICTQEC